MKKLPIQLQGKGHQSDFTFLQLDRTEDYALYKKTAEYKSYYEVFYIRKQHESIVNGIQFKEKELMPNDNMFGSTAWCFTDINDAINKFNQLNDANKPI